MKNIKLLFLSFTLLLTSCFYCSEQEGVDSLINSYNNNKDIFDSLPYFFMTNKDLIQDISYYNYEFIIGFKDNNIVYIKNDSVENELISKGFVEIDPIKRIIDLMKKENIEFLGIRNENLTLNNYCGNHIKNSQIYLQYNFREKEHNKNAIKTINKSWIIMKK